MLSEDAARATQHQLQLVQTRADVRIAGFLVQLGERQSKLGWSDRELKTPMSRTDLANYLGMTLECLSRVLAKFGRAGLIEASRTHIELLKPEVLEGIALNTR